MRGKDGGDSFEIAGEIPVVPLRNAVLFPGSLIPIEVNQQRSLAAVERASAQAQTIGIVTQIDRNEDGPDLRLYDVGCAARIHKVMRLAADRWVVILEGLRRIRILAVDRSGPCFVARVEPVPEPADDDAAALLRKTEALKESALAWIALVPEMPTEANALVGSIDHPGKLAYLLASQLDTPVEEKQKVLETIPLASRVDLVAEQVRRARERRA